MAQTISRKELYDLVWSKPMTKAAADFGISDVGLRKVCVKNLIPTPPLGYWAKKQAGHDVHQPGLPDKADGQAEQITIYGLEGTSLPEEIMQAVDTARQKVQARTLIPLSSPESSLHTVIRGTAKALRKAKPTDDVAYATGSNHCGIQIGIASVERTIVILDAIARALDEQGLTLEPGAKMKVVKGLDELTFSLTERVQTQKHIPTPEEEEKEKKRLAKRERDIRFGIYSFSNEKAYPEFDYIRTGELGIHITDQYVRGARRSWKDGKTQKIEDLIDEIAIGIVAYLEGVEARREEHERQRLEWKEQDRRRDIAKPKMRKDH